MTDKELIYQIQKNDDKKAFGMIYDRYHHLVYIVCLKYLKNNDDSQDMASQVFIKLMTDIHRFEIKNFKSWLLQVTRNACLMYLRNKKMHLVELEPFHQKEEVEERDFESEELKFNRLEYCMGLLSKEQLTCVKLFFEQSLRYKEIEEKTGFTFKSIKSYIQNAKRNLKNCMNQS